jgi:hypothetical protein
VAHADSAKQMIKEEISFMTARSDVGRAVRLRQTLFSTAMKS